MGVSGICCIYDGGRMNKGRDFTPTPPPEGGPRRPVAPSLRIAVKSAFGGGQGSAPRRVEMYSISSTSSEDESSSGDSSYEDTPGWAERPHSGPGRQEPFNYKMQHGGYARPVTSMATAGRTKLLEETPFERIERYLASLHLNSSSSDTSDSDRPAKSSRSSRKKRESSNGPRSEKHIGARERARTPLAALGSVRQSDAKESLRSARSRQGSARKPDDGNRTSRSHLTSHGLQRKPMEEYFDVYEQSVKQVRQMVNQTHRSNFKASQSRMKSHTDELQQLLSRMDREIADIDTKRVLKTNGRKKKKKKRAKSVVSKRLTKPIAAHEIFEEDKENQKKDNVEREPLPPPVSCALATLKQKQALKELSEQRKIEKIEREFEMQRVEREKERIRIEALAAHRQRLENPEENGPPAPTKEQKRPEEKEMWSVEMWKKKHDIPPESRIFIIRGKYPDIRQALREREWNENPHRRSWVFDLQWTLHSSDINYDALQAAQIVNHFKGNEAITTKAGLCNTIRNLKWYESVDISKFFPRCYDLSHPNELSEFVWDYRLSAAINVLVRFIKMVEANPRCRVHRASIMTAMQLVSNHLTDSFMLKEEGLSDNRIDLPVHAVSQMYSYLQGNIEQAPAREDENAITAAGSGTAAVLAKRPATAGPSSRSSSSLETRVADEYVDGGAYHLRSSASGSLTARSESGDKTHRGASGALTAREAVKDLTLDLPVLREDMLEETSSRLNLQAAGVLQQLSVFESQMSLNNGRNIWISKPGGTSRGVGVECHSSASTLLGNGRENGRVVQKYIENPMLIHNRKFDVRQWVLVTSWNPLQVWFYGDCIIRFASEEFSLDNTHNKYAHLCNQAVQRGSANFSKGPVKGNMWSSTEMQEYLNEKLGSGSIWDDKVVPAMKDIVRWVCQSAQEAVEHRDRSFELYGFDLMLDADMAPWLLEVNMSPDLHHSTEIKTRLASSMVREMFGIVIDYLPTAKLSPGTTPPAEAVGQWQLIHVGASRVEANTNDHGLVIEGQKLTRKHANFMKKQEQLAQAKAEERGSVVIQSAVRGWWGRGAARLVRAKAEACLSLQRFVRRWLAVRRAAALRRRRDAAKLIQRYHRGHACRKRFVTMRTRGRAAAVIQRCYRCRRARQEAERRRARKEAAFTIQRNYQYFIDRRIERRCKTKRREQILAARDIQKAWRRSHARRASGRDP